MAGPPGRWVDALRRRVADEGFQRWASRFPLTRWIARRSAARLFDLASGFVQSQVLAICVELDLFVRLRAGPLTVPQIAELGGLDAPSALLLVRAAAALDLVDRRGEWVVLGPLGAAMAGNAGAAAMVAHHRAFYADLTDPLAVLRRQAGEGALARLWPYAASGDKRALPPEAVAPYSALMAASNRMIADQVLAAWDPRQARVLLDVGGGEGVFLIEAARRAPALNVMLFDLPAVADRARSRFAETGLGVRASAVGGDFFADPIPRGADVISLIRIVHDHDDAPALRLLHAVRAALPPAGTLILAEPMDVPEAARASDVYFAFYLRAMGSGRPRSPESLAAMLRQAGFRHVTRRRTGAPLLTGLLVATA